MLTIGLAAGAVGAVKLQRRAVRIAWSVSAGLLLVVAMMGVAAAAAGSAGDEWEVLSGTWLRIGILRENDMPPQFEGPLPTVNTWRSEAVTRSMHEILTGTGGRAHHRGRWWVVAGSNRDWPTARQIYGAGAMPDKTPMSEEDIVGLFLLGPEGAYLLAAHIGQERYDGILLAPVAADHPDAWRCYNYRTLQRCHERIIATGSGPMMLRTQADVDELARLFSVAKTFIDVVGPSWAAVAWQDDRIDLLLVGPTHRHGRTIVRRPADQDGALVVPAEQLWPEEVTVRPLRVLRPMSPLRTVDLRQNLWRYHLKVVSARSAVPDGGADDPAVE